ncbi:RAMP superfamily CRISPR-associated protein [uncultured Chloroflexus sp.]|uniref:RAMP superfamily CRISPR-associated protein n=1 Tax=uncultured Chloroflexus sp. TaxID=214040 RepID=UPI002619726A|nr:RAMP superfamily CRISPR-associated protein [uncultured Chloroflexus sp.]
MHKTRYNALNLTLHLSPKGPLLIKVGGLSADPTLPDMPFVRTYHPEKGETIYIPGSSLKGVVRGFVEKALRTIDSCPDRPGPAYHNDWKWSCATFEAKKEEREDRAKWNCPQFLAELLKEKQTQERDLFSWEIYANSCGACRIFGHTRLKGRASFTDLLPVDEVKTEIRYGVAISRLSHAVAHGPFEMEVAVSGTFQGHLVLENFEIWQLGLLALAMESMNQGLVKVGFGKNRGFGEVTVTVQEAWLDEVTPATEATVWRGLAAFITEDEKERYGLATPTGINGMPDPTKVEAAGLYTRRLYDAERWAQIAHKAVEALSP